MRHTKKKLVTLSIYALFMTAMYGGYVGSLSWFDNKSTLPQDFKGESANAFFAGGDGTKDKPYIIKTARNFYNLCWLQYLGRFNRDTDEDGVINQVYFKISDDVEEIDCSTLNSALPPIGTTRYPFVGNLDGNNKVIKNYIITDKYSELTKHPSIIDTENTYYTQGNDTINYCSIIGTFGVIGYNTNAATDVDSSETSLYSFSTDQLAVNSVANLYIDNVTIRPKTTNTLAGLLAGYVSANITGCGVHYSNLDFSNGNTVIDSKKFNNKLSNYALIGDYNSSDYTWDGHTSESGNNWGGSIDTTTLVKRLYYIAGVSNVNSTTYSSNEAIDFDGKTTPSYNKDKYNAYFRSVNNGSLIWNSASGTLQYLYKGTYLPLNIDTSTAFAGNEIDATASGVSNWKTTEYYKNHTSEYDLISDSNTGYIVGGGIPTTEGGSPTGTGAKYIYLRKEMNFSSNLSNSISSSEYDNDNVKIYTVDTVNGSTSTQITSSTGFQRYSTVKANFDTKIAVTKSYCYAIRFQSINATNSDNWSDKVTVKINGNEKSNYQFLNSTINFTVNKPGYITVIISSFMGVGTKMFDLFKIDRNSDNSISKVTQINKIYGVANSGTYYYDDTSKNSNLLFNFENTHSLNVKSLYYFEIPVNAGDYAIGKYSATEGTDTSTGYLNYLDIGANAGSSSGSGSGTKSGTIKNVSFYYYDGSTLKKVTEDGTDVVFDISGDGSAIFYFNRIKDTGVLYFDESVNGLTRTLGSNVSGASSLASDNTCTAKAS